MSKVLRIPSFGHPTGGKGPLLEAKDRTRETGTCGPQQRFRPSKPREGPWTYGELEPSAPATEGVGVSLKNRVRWREAEGFSQLAGQLLPRLWT